MLLEIRLGVHPEIDDLVFRHFINFTQRAAEESRPVAYRLFDTEGRPPFNHGAFVEHAAVIFEKRSALCQHLIFDHFIVGQTKVATLLKHNLDMTRRRGMDHLVSHVVGKMFLQFRMAFEERQVALIGDAVEIVNLGDEPVPILPKDFDCLHRQRAIGHV